MKVLVFEWLTGGGLWWDRAQPQDLRPMQRQGELMLSAVVDDFIKSGIEVVVPIDGRLHDQHWERNGAKSVNTWDAAGLPKTLSRLAQAVDYVVMIAPEIDSCLDRCLRWVDDYRDKLISPDPSFVGFADNKQRTYNHLVQNGFASIPNGTTLSRILESKNGDDWHWPRVIKPIDGAGSEGVELIADWSRLRQLRISNPESFWVEPFVEGVPVSLSVLCGPAGEQLLPPTRQIFAQQPFGEYVGAGYPLNADLSLRATHLAQHVVNAMPQTKGYVGLDLVLSSQGATHDCLIEVNPRLTMSYLKLREISQTNLAKQMLNVALGRT